MINYEIKEFSDGTFVANQIETTGKWIFRNIKVTDLYEGPSEEGAKSAIRQAVISNTRVELVRSMSFGEKGIEGS